MLNTLKKLGPIVATLIFILFVTGIVRFLQEDTGFIPDKLKQAALFLQIAAGLFMVYVSLAVSAENPSNYRGRQQNSKPRKPIIKPAHQRKPRTADSDSRPQQRNSAPRQTQQNQTQSLPDKGPVTIHINNLAPDVFETHLREIFGKYGELKSVRIISDKETGESKGYGFIEMDSPSEAQKAIEGVNGMELSGKAITVAMAKARGRKGSSRR
ncbi:MAG: RNA recognition motif domain-containing protein [Phycisphaerae bacterium]|jgi:hypothetical protein